MPNTPAVSESDLLSDTDMVAWMSRLDDLVHDHLTWLTELDTAIGDSDHGVNLVRGVTALDKALREATSRDTGQILQVIGRWGANSSAQPKSRQCNSSPRSPRVSMR
jgi:dihydroxyacetone kinase